MTDDRKAQWINRGVPSRPAGEQEPFPGSRPTGTCKIPPGRRTFFEYRQQLHGPLVDCPYDTAAYSIGVVLGDLGVVLETRNAGATQ